MNLPGILLVEDEPASAFFFERAIKKLKIENPVRVAKDGREALNFLEGIGPYADRKMHPLPGLVLLDLKLPHASGFEVLKRLRAHPETRHLVTLILTSSASAQDVRTAYDLGANGYLVKPVHLTKLEEIVGSICGYWLIHNHLPPPS